MKGFLSFVVLAALLYCLTGCTQYWYQEGKTYSKCADELRVCREEMLKYADLKTIKIGGYDARFIEECMTEKGYISVTENDLPLRVKRKDPPKWYMHGVAGTLDE
ncbi:MAG: hypothetical protein FVQ84_16490 [Planctomycetes bacterium]|nr:hypothetical protein [Planctomycetota bacterium]